MKPRRIEDVEVVGVHESAVAALQGVDREIRREGAPGFELGDFGDHVFEGFEVAVIAVDRLQTGRSTGRVVGLTFDLDVEGADVVVEQFRPGVMDRLGLGYEDLRAINPRIIYCAITGYGQTGPRRDVAAHDLNYAAEAGMLAVSADPTGAPVLPNALIADIAAGAYPAVINVLLALRRRDATGEGAKIDIAMADGLFPFQYWAMGEGEVTGRWPAPGTGLVAGGSPRYQIYRTADGKFLSAAPLEQKFWENFCAAIGLPAEYLDDAKDPERVKRAVAALIASQSAEHWTARLAGKDVCCAIAASIESACRDPGFAARGLFDHKVSDGQRSISAIPVPIDPAFRSTERTLDYPRLGADNARLLK